MVADALGQVESRMAEQVVAIAESRSVEALGRAVRLAIEQRTGSPAIGFYLFKDACPALLFSSHVDEGMLDSYQSGLWRSDPILNHVSATGCCGDGETLVGRDKWQHSLTFRAISQWGFHYNLGGPIICGDMIVGVLYTAREQENFSYTASDRLCMNLVCRASSLAISSLINLGALRGLEMLPPAMPARQYSPPTTELLSPRLADVAIGLCRGQTNKEIAREIGISDQTVKDHLAILCRRFGVHNRTRLAARLATRLFDYNAV
ncbi:MAG: LuxR C-terminal-related transcriptional regulator [Bradyrhizobium sp.]